MDNIEEELKEKYKAIPEVDNTVLSSKLNKYSPKIHKYISQETLNYKNLHYNDELMSNEEAKEKGLPYSVPYLYQGRTLYKLYNTHMFSPMARQKKIRGKYNPFSLDSTEWMELTTREIYRNLYGYTCGALRITGYHYFFLNYSIVSKTIELESNETITIDSNPDFWKIHYDWFWAVEIAEKGIDKEEYKNLSLDIRLSDESLKGKKHITCAKTRRAGWSYLVHSMVMRDVAVTDPRTLNFKLDYIIASKEDYVSDLFDKVLTTKSYLDRETDYMFKHFYDRYDTKTRIRASEKDSEGVEIKTGGEAIGVVVNKNAQKVRGKGVYKIFAEEFGVFPAGAKALASILPLVEEGGRVRGMFIGFGTGGEATDDISAIQECFNKPSAFNMMEFNNSIFEDKATHTGFFVPCMYTNRLYMDLNGNPDLHGALEHQLEKRKKKEQLDAQSIVKFKAEEPITPSDIFNFGSSKNPFNIDKLVEARELLNSKFTLAQRAIVNSSTVNNSDYSSFPYYKYRLDYVFDASGICIGVKAVKDKNGYVEMIETIPQTINGTVPKGLYIAGIDSIDQGSEESAVGVKGSKLSMVVKKRTAPFVDENANAYVAVLSLRTEKVEDSYEAALKLSILFNCTINLERSKIRIINHFQKSAYFGDQSFRFCDEMMALVDSSNRGARGRKMFGTAPSKKNNDLMDSYLKSYIEDFVDNLNFLSVIDDCLYYSTTNRTKFDNVVALGLTELYEESLTLSNQAPRNPERAQGTIARYVYKTVNGVRKKVREEPKKTQNSQNDDEIAYYGRENGYLIMGTGFDLQEADLEAERLINEEKIREARLRERRSRRM